MSFSRSFSRDTVGTVERRRCELPDEEYAKDLKQRQDEAEKAEKVGKLIVFVFLSSFLQDDGEQDKPSGFLQTLKEKFGFGEF